MSIPTHVAPEKVRDLRTEADFTQAEAAELVFRHTSTWQDWESGRYPMPWESYVLFHHRMKDPKLAVILGDLQ